MSKEYAFEFPGTREDLLKKLNIFPDKDSSNGGIYYFKHNIVRFVDDEIHFGIERAGHSGGHWFVSKLQEREGKIEFNGTLQYRGPKKDVAPDKKFGIKRVTDKAGEWLLYIVVTPFVVVVYVIVKLRDFFKWLTNKTGRRPVVKPKTTEEKLFDLMEIHLGCVRKEPS